MSSGTLTHLSLFTGIGGLDLAAEWAGFETVGRYSAALEAITEPDKRKEFMERWQDGRSSLNDIGTYAHRLSKLLAGKEEAEP